jgi:DHA1 family tetracycline resistance protein-like MFS transporter
MLLSIFMVVFIDLIGFGIVIPILPYYGREFGANAATLGWLMAVYSLMQFLVAPLWGRLSDRIGRRPVLLLSLFGTAIAQILLGMASQLENPLFWLFFGRIFAGICAANISVAYAYVTDVTTPENRARGMGLIGAGFGLGFIVGPAVGGILSRYGYDAPMFAAAGLTFANLAVAWFKLREPITSGELRTRSRLQRRWGLSEARNLLARSTIARPILLFFLVTLAITQMEAIFAIFMFDKYGFGAEKAGVLLAIMGLVMAFVQGGLIGRASKLVPEIRLIAGGTFLSAVALSLFAVAGTPLGVVAALTLMALSHGFVQPSLSSLASRGAPDEQRGATMGIFHSAGSLARVIGPPSAGLLYDRIGISSPFWMGAAFLLLASTLALAVAPSLLPGEPRSP